MVNPRVRLPDKCVEILNKWKRRDGVEKANENVIKAFNSFDSLSNKHIGMDRRLIEMKDLILKLEGEKEDFKHKFDSLKSDFDLRVEQEILNRYREIMTAKEIAESKMEQMQKELDIRRRVMDNGK